jgi:hypothetical protein
MPDSHRLPCYALAGTQDAITLTQISTSPTLKCKDNVTSPFALLSVAHACAVYAFGITGEDDALHPSQQQLPGI